MADKAEQIKLWNAMDVLAGTWTVPEVERGLQMMRECRHPDAEWLASLFPAGEACAVTLGKVLQVMLQQGDDPRALHLAFRLGTGDEELLKRAAQQGYAPAQVALSMRGVDTAASFALARRAAEQGDRHGLSELGRSLYRGFGCQVDIERGLALLKEAASLECAQAQFFCGLWAFSSGDWERYHWMALAAMQKYGVEHFGGFVLELLPLFHKGEYRRILHTVAVPIRKNFDAATHLLFNHYFTPNHVRQIAMVLDLHDAMLSRARAAIACWSIVGRRCGVAKDIRLLIAKKAWEEVWLW